MSAEQPTGRLKRLEHILAHARHGGSSSGDPDAAHVHLASVPDDRIRQLTAELRDRTDSESDTISALTMRLLLNEYVAAVGHLRAVARLAAARVDGAAKPMKEARRAIHRHAKQHSIAAARRAARDQGADGQTSPAESESN